MSFIIWTGLTPPSEDCGAAKTHRHNELGTTTLSKQRFVAAVPSHTRSPSQARGSWHLPLSTMASSGVRQSSTYRRVVANTGLQYVARPRPYAYGQMHEESRGTDHALWYDPFFSQSPAALRKKKRFSPWRAPRKPVCLSVLNSGDLCQRVCSS